MEQELTLLKQELENQKRAFEDFKLQVQQQVHNGVDGSLVDFNDLIGLMKTVTVAGELTNILASKPSTIRDQILIDTTTATKKLYIYDAVGNVWRSVTIA